MSAKRSNQKAFLETETGKRIPCLFNPEKLQIGLSTNWKGEEIPGQEAPILKYGGGGSGTIDVELFFDTTDDGSPVTKHTDKLIDLLKVDTSIKGYSEAKQNGRPPWVRFHWGKFHSFKSVLTDLDLQFTYFAPDGKPLRATAGLTLVQYEPEEDWPKQNPTSGTPKPARSHLVQPGETLDRIAARYYDDPTKWRQLAELNGIRDPFDVSAGMLVDVPVED